MQRNLIARTLNIVNQAIHQVFGAQGIVKILFIIVICSLMEINPSFGQSNNEDEYIFNAKRLSFTKEVYPQDSFLKYINTLTAIKLISHGFENISFFLVFDSLELRDIQHPNNTIDSLRMNNLIYGYCEFIYAVNTKTKNTYRLKGYEVNDFNRFYYQEILPNRTTLKIGHKQLLSTLKVDRLDLVCLYHKYIKKRKNSECAPCIDTSKPLMVY